MTHVHGIASSTHDLLLLPEVLRVRAKINSKIIIAQIT
jgi:hypothetical protein